MKVKYWEEAKKDLSIKDDNLRKIINMSGDEYLNTSKDPFVTLFNSILGQQISVSAATSIKKKITSKVKITPKDINKISNEILKNCGLSRMKISYLKDLSSKIINKEISFKDLNKFEDNEVIKYLTNVKGIGDWTAEMFMIFHLGRSNILPVKDIGIINSLVNMYGEDKKNINFEKYYLLWSPWNTVASWYLWRNIDQKIISY
ncbi:MAG: DNA-3-methyladenine glycosylase family protein [Dehalococcoidia bacterium]|tara:strand:+ start:266 stop:874 length:609 start_codon:yes stop_codon:yes gene_type:complete